MLRIVNKKIRIFDVYYRLPKSIYVLFGVRVVTSIASFIMPFFSLYLTYYLGYSKVTAGQIVSLNTFLYFPATLIGGFLADKVNKKNGVIGLGILRAVMLAAVIGCPTAVIRTVLLMVGVFVSTISYPMEDALVADLTSVEQRRNTYSLLYLGSNVGIAISTMIAAFLFNNFINLIFIIEVSITLIGVALMFRFVPYIRSSNSEKANLTDKKHSGQKGNKLFKTYKYLFIFLLSMMIFSFGYNQCGFAMPLFMNDVFGDKGTSYYGFLMSLNGFEVVFFTAYITKISKKMSAIWNIVIAGALYLVGFGMFFYTRNVIVTFVLTFIWTLGEIFGSVNITYYATTHVQSRYRGRILSLVSASMRIGAFLNPFIMGIIMDLWGSRITWLITAMPLVVSVILLVFLAVNDKKYLARININIENK